MSDETKADELKLQESELFFLIKLNEEINAHQAGLNLLLPKRANLFIEIEQRLGLAPGSLVEYDLKDEGVLVKKPTNGNSNGHASSPIAHKASKRTRRK